MKYIQKNNILSRFIFSGQEVKSIYKFLLMICLIISIVGCYLVLSINYFVQTNISNNLSARRLYVDYNVPLDVFTEIPHVMMATTKDQAWSTLETVATIEGKEYELSIEVNATNDILNEDLFDDKIYLEKDEIIVPKVLRTKNKVIDTSSIIGDKIIIYIEEKFYSINDKGELVSKNVKTHPLELKIKHIYSEKYISDASENVIFANKEIIECINKYMKGNFEKDINELYDDNLIVIDDVENIESVKMELARLEIHCNQMLNFNEHLLILLNTVSFCIIVIVIIAAIILLILSYKNILSNSLNNIIFLNNVGYTKKQLLIFTVCHEIFIFAKVLGLSLVPSIFVCCYINYAIFYQTIDLLIWCSAVWITVGIIFSIFNSIIFYKWYKLLK